MLDRLAGIPVQVCGCERQRGCLLAQRTRSQRQRGERHFGANRDMREEGLRPDDPATRRGRDVAVPELEFCLRYVYANICAFQVQQHHPASGSWFCGCSCVTLVCGWLWIHVLEAKQLTHFPALIGSSQERNCSQSDSSCFILSSVHSAPFCCPVWHSGSCFPQCVVACIVPACLCS